MTGIELAGAVLIVLAVGALAVIAPLSLLTILVLAVIGRASNKPRKKATRNG
ncbi:hypothetical protein [Zhihengliuella sp.]|uniref:hypothetical protein n=1 Tax=Zhihengliuella sp. TaxID=1954483 RepID=UPI0028124CF9|nr:hypothetical protein [Zhihengliuella sp.]